VVSSDFIVIQAETIWASLKQQPRNQPLSLERLLGEEDGVPIALGELFSKKVNDLALSTGTKRLFLSEPSTPKTQPAVTDFRLCKEFGWTPTQLAKQPAKTIQQFSVILNELDRQTQEETKKHER
jgi:hypothetical protein